MGAEKPINIHAEAEKELKKFSFVVPVYQTEDLLEKSMESLLAQDYKNLEIIVVADGKSAKAEKIFYRLQKKDKRMIKYIEIEHGGAPKARNEGYKHITGDYVSFWDSDCFAEIGMVRMWAKMFIANPDVGFVYTGHRLIFDKVNEPYGMPLESEKFDPWLLTCYNYIPTMFPMKKEIFPGFDESLKSLQDWDMWLSVVEKGHKGVYLEGPGWSSDATRKGISAAGCTPETWLERYKTVRTKHGIDRKYAFVTAYYKTRAIELSKMFDWDFHDGTRFHLKNDYKVMYCLGFYYKTMESILRGFKNAPKDCIKILHWMGDDVESLMWVPYKMMKTYIPLLNGEISKHYCENEVARKMLEDIGIKADIMTLPMKVESVTRPKDFKVYVEYEPKTEDLIKLLKESCPDIKMETPEMADLAEYACFMSLTVNSEIPSENFKKFMAVGRFAITNYNVLYGNTTELDRVKIVEKIRDIKKRWKNGETNEKAMQYYSGIINPETFKRTIIEGVAHV